MSEVLFLERSCHECGNDGYFEPLFVKYTCKTCDSKIFGCQECLEKIPEKEKTDIWGCEFCLDHLAWIDIDNNSHTQYAIDLRKSADELTKDFLKRHNLDNEHFAFHASVVGPLSHYTIYVTSPLMSKRGLFNKLKQSDFGDKNYKRPTISENLFYLSGYDVRIYRSEKFKTQLDGYLRILNWNKFPGDFQIARDFEPEMWWYSGLDRKNMLDVVFSCIISLSTYSLPIWNTDLSPYPVTVRIQSAVTGYRHRRFIETSLSDDVATREDRIEDVEKFKEYWVCQCGTANYSDTSICANCDVDLSNQNTHNKARSRYIPTGVKKEVFERDQGKCVICGSEIDIEFDHIIPFSKGGSSTANNIQILCKNHNRRKSDNIE